MLIVFPSFPGSPREPDPAFTGEADAARAAGFQVAFVDVELNLGGAVKLRGLPAPGGPCLYRGWILKVEAYEQLARALEGRGFHVVTSAHAYRHAYELPRWYAAIGPDATPRSIWEPGSPGSFDLDAIAARVQAELGDGPVLVKDYLKSRKHEWFDACFIRNADDAAEIKRVVSNFLRLQEDSFAGGLVFREFVELKRIGLHGKSRMPLVNEHRCFVWNTRVFYEAPYWAEGAYDGTCPDRAQVEALISNVESPFFAVDMAEREAGGWLAIEVNDGGSAGVPEGGDAGAFYDALARVCA